MHFLCLHGLGTNSEILELQTTAIRYALGHSHTYDFVEGELDWPMEPGIAHLVNPTSTFHAYFDPASPPSILGTLTQLSEHIATASPPYDAIMGFSHGSCLASTLLLHGALKGEAMPVQCAVFLSPGMALDWEALERGEVRMFGGGRVGEGMVFEGEVDERRMAKGKGAIKIPTAHIWGQNDSCAPRQGRLLSELCAEEVRETALHQGGHSVPGAGVKRELEEAVRAIEKAMKRAEGVI